MKYSILIDEVDLIFLNWDANRNSTCWVRHKRSFYVIVTETSVHIRTVSGNKAETLIEPILASPNVI